MSKTETYRYLVHTGDSAPTRIDAAYYVHEDEFTIFKSESGGIAASFANRHIVSIQRETVAVSSGGPLMGTITVGATTFMGATCAHGSRTAPCPRCDAS